MLTFKVCKDLVFEFEDVFAFILLFDLEGDALLKLLVESLVDIA